MRMRVSWKRGLGCLWNTTVKVICITENHKEHVCNVVVTVAWITRVNNSTEFSMIIRDYAQHLEGEARSSTVYQRTNNRIRGNRCSVRSIK